jgi:hypothetical protein
MRPSYPPTLEIVGDLRPGGFPKYSPAFSDVSNAEGNADSSNVLYDGAHATPPNHCIREASARQWLSDREDADPAVLLLFALQCVKKPS